MSDQDRLSQFFGGLKGLFSSAKEASAPPQRPAPAPPRKGSDAFVRRTAPLAGQPTSPLPQNDLTPAQKAEASKKRMAVIMTYMKDKNAIPEFKDPKFIYKIISDERTYQTAMVSQQETDLREFMLAGGGQDPELAERRDAMEQQIQATRNRLTQLFMLLKHITGVKGKTGGTGFLPTDMEF